METFVADEAFVTSKVPERSTDLGELRLERSDPQDRRWLTLKRRNGPAEKQSEEVSKHELLKKIIEKKEV